MAAVRWSGHGTGSLNEVKHSSHGVLVEVTNLYFLSLLS